MFQTFLPLLRRANVTRALLCTLCLCASLFAGIANGDVVSYSSSYNFNHTGSVTTGLVSIGGTFTNTQTAASTVMNLPRFNTALGTLNQATVTITAPTSTFSVAPTGLLSLVSSGSATRNLSYTVTAGTTSGGNSSSVTTSAGTLLTLLNAGGGEIGGALAPASIQFSAAADLLQLSGSGSVSLQVNSSDTLSIFALVSVLYGGGLQGSGTYAGSVTIAYDYTPWALTGYVYRDVDHNGFKATSETGTGLVLYAKLLSDTALSGPAIKATTVDPSTGFYAFGAARAGYRIIIDDNNSLADATPLVPPAGWTATLPVPMQRDFVLMGDLSGQNFGLIQATVACGRIFRDDGLSAGVANDGVLNGGEAGIGSQPLQLLNASSTVLDSTASSGDGSYCLYIPGTVSGGTALRVVHQRDAATLATGATVGNSAGTFSRTQDTISFNFVAASNYSNLNFGTVPLPTLTGSGRETGAAADVIWFSHRLSFSSVGQATFSISQVSSPPMPTLSIVIYNDTNNNAKLDPGELPIAGPVAVTRGSTVPLLLKVTVPTVAPFEATSRITLSVDLAFTNASPALTYTLTADDVLKVLAQNAAALHLIKAVDRSTAAPGATLVYTITFTNTGTTPITNLVINDATPTYTTFLTAASSSLPTGLGTPTLSAPAVSSKGSLQWVFTGQLLPSATGSVQFSVVIDP